MSTSQLKETKVPSVLFVGDDDVLSHILDREGGMYGRTVEEVLVDCTVLKNVTVHNSHSSKTALVFSLLLLKFNCKSV